MTEFPNGFLWGAATAPHQVEGGNTSSDLWRVEHFPGTFFSEPSGDACDSYHRYGEDIALLAGAGLSSYRFGVEWARIEPEEGLVSRAALDHYRRMLVACHEHGVTPVVTYNHFSTPHWFAASGGWDGDGAVDRFARYSETVTRHLGDLIPWVCTINEPNIVAMMLHARMAPVAERGAEGGIAASGADELRGGAVPTIPAGLPPMAFPSPNVERMTAAHRAAFSAIKSVRPEIQVGWAPALVDFQAADGGEETLERVRRLAQLDWLDTAREDDWVGVQTYSRERFGPHGRLPVPDGASTTQTGWEVYPEALGHTVLLAQEHTGRPVIVTENGIATDDDSARITYTASALRSLAAAIERGVDVRGYLHWTLLDNFEWMSGFKMTFGLIAVDRTTFVRAPKPSLAWLGSVARANAVS